MERFFPALQASIFFTLIIGRSFGYEASDICNTEIDPIVTYMPDPSLGPWSEWESWSPTCSLSCVPRVQKDGEIAVHTRYRYCLNTIRGSRDELDCGPKYRDFKNCTLELEQCPEQDTLNVAKGKLAGTNGVTFGDGFKPHLAVDGNYARNAGPANQCFIGQKSAGKMPNWWVDLENNYLVTHLKIYTRSDCCGNQFQGVAIKIGSSITDVTTCANYAGPPNPSDILKIQCNKLGSFIYMTVAASQYLTLCEVEVHAGVRTDTATFNLAKGKRTGTDGIIYGDGWKPHLAVDGKYSRNASPANQCFMGLKSHGQLPNWWVDLQEDYYVTYLKIYTRNDCCGNQFEKVAIKIGSSINDVTNCGRYYYSTSIDDVPKINCYTAGSFIYMEADSQRLTLCEVEVYTNVQPSDGFWSEWRSDKCIPETKDKFCSTGYDLQKRSCDNPPPYNGGQCEGASIRSIICWTQEGCPANIQPPINVTFRRINDSVIISWRRAPYGDAVHYFVLTFELSHSGSNGTKYNIPRKYPQPNGEDYNFRINELQSPNIKYSFWVTSIGYNNNENNATLEIFWTGEVDGAWGPWSLESPCSSACQSKAGQNSRQRKCNDPEPSEKGKPCTGESVDLQRCWGENRHC